MHVLLLVGYVDGEQVHEVDGDGENSGRRQDFSVLKKRSEEL